VNKAETIRWIITAALRLLAGYVAIRFGKEAVAADTWAALGNGLAAVVIAVISIITSVKARKTLLNAEPPE